MSDLRQSMHMAYSASYQSLLQNSPSICDSGASDVMEPPVQQQQTVSQNQSGAGPAGPVPPGVVAPGPIRTFSYNFPNMNNPAMPYRQQQQHFRQADTDSLNESQRSYSINPSRPLLHGSPNVNDGQRSYTLNAATADNCSNLSPRHPPSMQASAPAPKIWFLCSKIDVINAKYIVAYFDLFIGLIALIDQTMSIFKQKLDYDMYVSERVQRYRMGHLDADKDTKPFEPTWAEIQRLEAEKTKVLLKILEELVVILSVIVFHLSACVLLIWGLNRRRRTFEIYYLVISGLLLAVFFVGVLFFVYVLYGEQQKDAGLYNYAYENYKTLVSGVCVGTYVLLRAYFVFVVWRKNPPKLPPSQSTTAAGGLQGTPAMSRARSSNFVGLNPAGGGPQNVGMDPNGGQTMVGLVGPTGAMQTVVGGGPSPNFGQTVVGVGPGGGQSVAGSVVDLDHNGNSNNTRVTVVRDESNVSQVSAAIPSATTVESIV